MWEKIRDCNPKEYEWDIDTIKREVYPKSNDETN